MGNKQNMPKYENVSTNTTVWFVYAADLWTAVIYAFWHTKPEI